MSGSDQEQQGRLRIPEGVEGASSTPKWAKTAAKKEERNWSELEAVKLENDKRWLKIYGWLLIAITVVLAAAFLLAFGALTLHYVTSWCWLSPHQLDKLQSVLFSGGMGAIVTSIVRTQINKAR